MRLSADTQDNSSAGTHELDVAAFIIRDQDRIDMRALVVADKPMHDTVLRVVVRASLRIVLVDFGRPVFDLERQLLALAAHLRPELAQTIGFARFSLLILRIGTADAV